MLAFFYLLWRARNPCVDNESKSLPKIEFINVRETLEDLNKFGELVCKYYVWKPTYDWIYYWIGIMGDFFLCGKTHPWLKILVNSNHGWICLCVKTHLLYTILVNRDHGWTLFACGRGDTAGRRQTFSHIQTDTHIDIMSRPWPRGQAEWKDLPKQVNAFLLVLQFYIQPKVFFPHSFSFW